MSYAGDLTPTEAFCELEGTEGAALIDVRTRAELAFVGVPDLRPIGKDLIHIEWQRYPDGAMNHDFADDLAEAGLEPTRPALFICRSGNRSAAAAAAATRAGYEKAYNVAEGFEGPLDTDGHRGTAGGWKAAGLPWRQS